MGKRKRIENASVTLNLFKEILLNKYLKIQCQTELTFYQVLDVIQVGLGL